MHAGNCPLNISSYQPSGDCIGSQQKIKLWHTIKTTLCCRNTLTFFTKALALQAKANPQKGPIFLPQEQWTNCTTAPFPRQNTVSGTACGFGDFFQGSNRCSNLSFLPISQEIAYKNALTSCSSFDQFTDDACFNCTQAVWSLKNLLLNMSRHDGDDDNFMCAVAAVILVVAGMDGDSRIEDFFQCLRVLDVADPDYLKIKYSLAQVLLALLIGTILLVLIIMLVKYVTKKKPDLRRMLKSKVNATWSGLYRFSKAEIENAISLANEMTLGRGSAGQVYKGILPSGQAVAIKHIYKHNKFDSFKREVDRLSRIRHPNLVCLFGCCIEDEDYYLVYEFCSGGNLAQQLLRKDTPLTWETRVRILRDCAYALKFLHRNIEGCIVHRDIKLTNILLTEDLEAKLSDFGLAKMLGMEESKVFTDVRGTIGYMDPEYMSNAKLTCASDIYSFGIVALQILSGQRVIELNLDARDQLTRKAKDVSIGSRPLSDFEDPRLNGEVNRADFKAILQIAVLCVSKSSSDRPNIEVMFEEMDKAWKNTKKTKQDPTSSSITSMSTSMEAIPV
ncbi:hypothetical protein UlMin_029941 [Ulmus minor]